MKLYDYLKNQLSRQDPHPAIDHNIRAELHADGRISFYIHAAGRDSDTADFWISDAGIFEKGGGLSKQAEFLTHPKAWRDTELQRQSAELVNSGYKSEDLG